MLYNNRNTPYCEEDFSNPPSEYRGAPFWAWNCDMEEEDIIRMTEMFRKMGMGGAHLHSRTGMDMPYLKERFMQRVKQACECAKERDMHVWLYDEDRWPSGYGGGYITKEDRYRSRVLIFSPEKLGDIEEQDFWKMTANGKCTRSNNHRLLAVYSVNLDPDGWLNSYEQINEESVKEKDKDTVWYAYLEISGNNPWFNGQAYSNNLDPRSVKKFIEVTHEAYYREVGNEFGSVIPAIFTDEPQFSFKQNMAGAMDREMISIPFTDDFPDTYQKKYGEDFMKHLPEVFFDQKNGYSVTRYRYHDHLTERFVSAYADQIGSWCETHGIAMTGHVMREASLKLQTQSVGEAMRFYRSMQLPGIDMLAWRTEYNTAKQCQSAVHQFGREGMLSELYGVTNWDFDFRNHKLLGDWQAALGVTVRVHHLAWTSMAGEAKRDYPAPISYQSPWYQEYKQMEDYFARVNTVLTRGKCIVNLGVLHPVESYWLCYGSEEKTGQLRRQLDDDFDRMTRWLIGDTKDFDLIAESLVKQLYKKCQDGRVEIGEMSYSAILAPNMLTIRSETLEMLKDFRNAGGRVIFTGYTPEYLDGIRNENVAEFVRECEWIPFGQNSILSALDGISDLEIFDSNGIHTENLITQMRKDGNEKWIFIAHKPPRGQDQIVGADAYSSNCPREYLKKEDRDDCQQITLKIKGTWSVEHYDAWNGRVKKMNVFYKGENTCLRIGLYGQDSLLLRLYPADSNKVPVKSTSAEDKQEYASEVYAVRFQHKVNVTLSEPNVLLLDMAEFALDGGSWQPKEEVLRLDNRIRDYLGMQYRMEAFPQPWTMEHEQQIKHTLHLRFHIFSRVNVSQVELAMEHPESCSVIWNGKQVSPVSVGYYVDRDIRRIVLGEMCQGDNELLVSMPFGQKTDVEAMYLLGDFGVRVMGDEAEITEPVREMHFGNWTMEGLPFYGGNVTYHIPVEGTGDPCKVSLPKFRSPLIAVELDGKRQGIIAISPYTVITEPIQPGRHFLDLIVYGNRYNTFGALHNTDEGKDVYCSPNFWRSKGSLWSYEYQLHPTGPLTSPVIKIIRLNAAED